MRHTVTVGKALPTVHFQLDHQGEFHCGNCKLYNGKKKHNNYNAALP